MLLLCCSSPAALQWAMAVPGFMAVLADPGFAPGGHCEVHGAMWQQLIAQQQQQQAAAGNKAPAAKAVNGVAAVMQQSPQQQLPSLVQLLARCWNAHSNSANNRINSSNSSGGGGGEGDKVEVEPSQGQVSSSGLQGLLPVLQLMVDMQQAAKGRRPWGLEEMEVLKQLASMLRALPTASAAADASVGGDGGGSESKASVSAAAPSQQQQQQEGRQGLSNGVLAGIGESRQGAKGDARVADGHGGDSDDEDEPRSSADDLFSRSIRKLQPQCLRLLKQLLDEQESSRGKAD